MRRRLSYSESDEEPAETSSAHQKPTIKLKEWLHSFKHSNSQTIKHHIISFLLSEGLFEVAQCFSEEAGIPSTDSII